jgi:hypothetical protein
VLLFFESRRSLGVGRGQLALYQPDNPDGVPLETFGSVDRTDRHSAGVGFVGFADASCHLFNKTGGVSRVELLGGQGY